ncbi:MAG: hypothetical protein Q8R37_02300 [Nanoarchaeota archaeon]|nr:hypothetical protein [Nanoarchaeota archaeon]
MTTNFIKKIVDKKITDDVHHAFIRYSLGEFVKEPMTVKIGKKDVTIQSGFEYLNFLQNFIAENATGSVTIEGTIESVNDLSANLKKMGITFEEKRRFGKSGTKFVIASQAISADTYTKIVASFFNEYLLCNVTFADGLLKVKKQSTPKLGSPTEKFVTLKMQPKLFAVFKKDYLFDVTAEFTDLVLNQTYRITEIKVNEALLAKDANKARKEAKRCGEIKRKITLDGKVVQDYTITFEV